MGPRAFTPVTAAIVIVCVAIELVATLMGAGFARSLMLGAGLVPARVTGVAVGLEGPVPPMATLVAQAFLHAGLFHLAMNMLFLAWIGPRVERAIGPVRFALLFLGAAVAGSLLEVVVKPASVVPVVGASGAVSGVFATYALLFARASGEEGRFLGLSLPPAAGRALRYAALWIGLNLLAGAAINLPGTGGIAIWSHIGGFLAGLAVGLLLLRRFEA